MNTTSTFSDTLRGALLHPTNGIVGMVDGLLTLCRDRTLQFEWHGDVCRIVCLDSDSQEVIDVPLRLSVFRAILARVAALCNEQRSGSVTPYGGKCDLSIGSNPASILILQIDFVNTAATQRVSISPLGVFKEGSFKRLFHSDEVTS